MQESFGKITHFSFIYKKVNKTDTLQQAGCNRMHVIIIVIMIVIIITVIAVIALTMIIIMMVIPMCYLSREHTALSLQKLCEHKIWKT